MTDQMPDTGEAPNLRAAHGEAPVPDARVPQARSGDWRENRASRALSSALRKQAAGVPTYTVHEAAALLSISPEHLYRLIRAEAFPAVRLRNGEHGRYVIPAQALRQLLDDATATGGTVDAAEHLDGGSGH